MCGAGYVAKKDLGYHLSARHQLRAAAVAFALQALGMGHNFVDGRAQKRKVTADEQHQEQAAMSTDKTAAPLQTSASPPTPPPSRPQETAKVTTPDEAKKMARVEKACATKNAKRSYERMRIERWRRTYVYFEQFGEFPSPTPEQADAAKALRRNLFGADSDFFDARPFGRTLSTAFPV